MKTIERQIICPECHGVGTVEYGPECYMPASMCCGGCYKTATCEDCDGTGEVKQTGKQYEADEADEFLDELDDTELLIEWDPL